jgi:hypothetical protein
MAAARPQWAATAEESRQREGECASPAQSCDGALLLVGSRILRGQSATYDIFVLSGRMCCIGWGKEGGRGHTSACGGQNGEGGTRGKNNSYLT